MVDTNRQIREHLKTVQNGQKSETDLRSPQYSPPIPSKEIDHERK